MDNVSNFKNWFDAIWLGDEEHGQFIPNKNDEDYAEYLEQYTLAHGAYKYALARSKERIAELEKEISALKDRLSYAPTQSVKLPNGGFVKVYLVLVDDKDKAMKGSNDETV